MMFMDVDGCLWMDVYLVGGLEHALFFISYLG
jgi:hypothetical protein